MENSHATTPKKLMAYCKRCHEYYEVFQKNIFSGGDFATYATSCPECGLGRGLPFKEVEKVFGKLKL